MLVKPFAVLDVKTVDEEVRVPVRFENIDLGHVQARRSSHVPVGGLHAVEVLWWAEFVICLVLPDPVKLEDAGDLCGCRRRAPRANGVLVGVVVDYGLWASSPCGGADPIDLRDRHIGLTAHDPLCILGERLDLE